MNLLDASAIFTLFQSNRFSVIRDGATIPLARYEIGNIIWKNFKAGSKGFWYSYF